MKTFWKEQYFSFQLYEYVIIYALKIVKNHFDKTIAYKLLSVWLGMDSLKFEQWSTCKKCWTWWTSLFTKALLSYFYKARTLRTKEQDFCLILSDNLGCGIVGLCSSWTEGTRFKRLLCFVPYRLLAMTSKTEVWFECRVKMVVYVPVLMQSLNQEKGVYNVPSI